MSDRRLLSPGDEFEKYVIERELGHGGMGAVYLVRHRILDTEYALKVLYPEVATRDKQYVERFIREGRLAGQIRHKNLIAVYDAGQCEKNGMYYLVMDFVGGGSVRDRLKKEHYVDMLDAISIVRQVASALEAAQNHNMVHRDIKPDNIMFDDKGVVRLADLGIAKATDDKDTGLTLEASVFGTPAYMSPEQAKDSSKVDTRADIYSLGIVFYEMLTGRRPFGGSTTMEILSHVIDETPAPDVRTFSKDFPEDVAKLVSDMLEKDREKRICNPTELIRRIDALDLSAFQKPSPGADEDNTDVTMPTMASPLGQPEAAPAEAEPPRTDVTLPTMANAGTAAAAPKEEQPPSKTLDMGKAAPKKENAPEPTLVQEPPRQAPPAVDAKPEATLVMTSQPDQAPPKKGGKKILLPVVAVMVVALVVAAGLVLTQKRGDKPATPEDAPVEGAGTTVSAVEPHDSGTAPERPAAGTTPSAPEAKPSSPAPAVEKPVVARPAGETSKPAPVAQTPAVTQPTQPAQATQAAQPTEAAPQAAQATEVPAAPQPPQPVETIDALGMRRVGRFEDGGVVVFGADNGNANALFKELSKNDAFASVGFQAAHRDLRKWGDQLSDIQGLGPGFVVVVISNEKGGFQFKRMLQGLVKALPASKAAILLGTSDSQILDDVKDACNPVGMYFRQWASPKELSEYILGLKKELNW